MLKSLGRSKILVGPGSGDFWGGVLLSLVRRSLGISWFSRDTAVVGKTAEVLLWPFSRLLH